VWHIILVFIAGLLVGMVNGVVGGGSIIAYPVLLAVGLPPVTATINNSLGVSSANIFALFANIRHGRVDLRPYIPLAISSAVAAGAGCAALLLLPTRVFESLAPFLLLFATCTLFIPTKPHSDHRASSLFEIGAIGASGIYCGYFGPGQGVMVLATLSRNSSRTRHEINTGKNLIIALTSVVTSGIFIMSGHVVLWAVLALFTGSAIGGYLGGIYVTRVSAQVFRALIMIVGFSASIWLFFHTFA